MTIEPKNLVLYQSERLADTPDGGGQYNGQIVIDGQSNNLFTDVSELDRTMGRVSLRKIFAGVNTADTDMLMGATVFVSKNPSDPNVSALLFSTQSHTDERSQAQNRIENYLAKGGQVAGVPLDTHWQGMKILQVCMFLSDEPNQVGDSIVLISNENKPNQVEQYVRILKVETRIAKMIINHKEIEYKIATYNINDPLATDFVGLSAGQWYDGVKSETIIRDTLVADTGKYFGSVALAENVNKGDFTVKGASIYAQIIPSAQAETPIVDVNAIGERVALVAGNTQKVQFNTTVNARTSQNLYIGSSVFPNSLSFSLNGQAITDDGGLLKYANGTQIGTVDYQRGLLQWTVDIGSFSSVVIEFTPAVASVQPSQSDSVLVTQQSQSLNYTGMLVPLPSMGSVSISYMAQGKFYEVRDMGNGHLKANGDGLGSGTIDYETGSWTLTCGALPDVDTPILIHWATPITTFSRANTTVKPAQIAFDLGQEGIAANSLTATWQVNGQQKTAQSNAQGQFTGDATGFINYATGQGYIIPAVLPSKGTQISLNYQHGTPKLTAQQVSPDTANTLRFRIGSGAIQKNSVELLIPVTNPLNTVQSQINLTDVPTTGNMGNLLNSLGQVQGTIDYNSGQVVVTPAWDRITHQQVYKPAKRNLENMLLGITQISKIEGVRETLKAYFDTQIAIKYRDSSSSSTGNKTIDVNKLALDVNDINEPILDGSLRFTLGRAIFVDKLGQIYQYQNDGNTLSGEINYSTGVLSLSNWTAEQENRVQLQSLTTSSNALPVNHVCFRTPTIPLRVGSFTMTINTLEHGRITLKANEQGVIQHEKAIGKVSYDTGFVDVHFIQKTLITPDNHAEIKAKDWYHADLEYQDGGKTYINVPIWVIADSVRYNAISYSYIPLDKDVLGLSATRLPLDGRVPIFRVGDIGVICAEKVQELDEPIAGKQFTLQDQRLSFVEIVDSVGAKLDPTLYTVDYEQGTLTLGGDFTIGRLQPPLTAVYRYQDMGLIRDVQINGQISFTKPVTHDYSPEHSIVGSALIIGDMYARYANKFEQVTWNAKWENVSTDESLSANYNDALYPIVVTNKGAIQERWALVFTDNTNFRIIGETSGLIGIGNINEDCSPINPITQVPYFTISKDGWGSGWTNGNTLRFNTHASMYPIWCIRTVKQSEPTTLSDQFQLMLRGDIDR